MKLEMTTQPTPGQLDGLIAEIALRLADEETIHASVQQLHEHANYPTAWEPVSLAMGPLGNAILFSTLHRIGISGARDWKSLADDVLERYTDDVIRDAAKSDSLFGGAGGAVLAYIVAATSEPRWLHVAETLAEQLADQTLALDSVPDEGDLSDTDYDMISGRAGTLVAISIASRQFPRSVAIAAARNRLFDDIDDLLSRGETLADTAWIDPKHYPNDNYVTEFPYGYYNMGLSHGLPGLLVALASTNVTGYRNEKRYSLIAELTDLILEAASNDSFGLAWPAGYGREKWQKKLKSPSEHRAPNAWCYGAPGIALSLARAGTALRDNQLIERARNIMCDALTRTITTGSLELMSPSFCHGIAGILACSVSIFGSSIFYNSESVQHQLIVSLLSKANKDHPLIFQDFEEPNQHLDNPTVIQGAAGIALTLTLVRDEHLSPGWQNMFGLE